MTRCRVRAGEGAPIEKNRNPAYQRDRDLAFVFGLRVHAQFQVARAPTQYALREDHREGTMRDISELPFSMSLAAALAGRASVRNFKPDVLTRGQVHSLLLAAVQAPTARHQEPWAFVVVQDKTLLRRISDRAKPLLEDARRLHVDRHGRGHGGEVFADPKFNIFYNAGTLIVVCGQKDAPFLAADCWMAAENIVLAAHAAGLGSCVIGSAVGALDMEDVRQELGIPVATSVVAPIIVGVPAQAAETSPRKEPHVLHWSHDLA